jgi:hypothetical protein
VRERVFQAKYERRPGGWLVTVDDKRVKVATIGRTLDKARVNVVSELAKELGAYPGNVVIDDMVDLSPDAEARVAAARAARNDALEAAALSQERTAEAAAVLLREGLSLRDAAYVLGISHARVQQILPRKAATKGTQS